MSLRRASSWIGTLPILLAALVVVGCSAAGPLPGLPGGYRLVQKDRFQALYGPDGRIQRLLQDTDRDGRAEAVVVYGAAGRPERGELDTDADGLVDRWEFFRADGTLERVGVSVARNGRPDRWEVPGR